MESSGQQKQCPGSSYIGEEPGERSISDVGMGASLAETCNLFRQFDFFFVFMYESVMVHVEVLF
jgi:hypothetical protein